MMWSALRRTKIGSYDIKDAIDVEDISSDKGMDLYNALSFMERYFIEDDRYSDIFNGKDIIVDSKDNIIWIPNLKKSKFNSQRDEFYDIILKYCEKEENDEQ